MTKVIVYLEGPSDRAALEALLAPLLAELRQNGIGVFFFAEGSGDRKKYLLLTVPEKAVNILQSQPRTVVVVMPDLYPKNRGFSHTTLDELRSGALRVFRSAAERKRVRDLGDLESRFRVFCFKHDMEVLLLASPDALKMRVGAMSLSRRWSPPVEEIDHHRPPKKIVEEVFAQNGHRYRDTVDAPVILRGRDHRAVARQCPQGFGPFVDFLASFLGSPESPAPR